MTKNPVKMAQQKEEQQQHHQSTSDDDKKQTLEHSGSSRTNSDTTKVIASQSYVARVKKFYVALTNHDYDECFGSYDNLRNFMFKPVDSSSLGVGRMLFGFMMLLDIPEERSGADLDYRWGEPKDCRFPLFSFLAPLTLPRMGILYAVMWLGALGITLGYKFKVTCTMFLIPYWYLFLLDKSSWNNHSYLYGLIGSILLTTDANRFCSIDAWLHESKANETVPFWNYFLIKFQFFVLYFFAGMKKMCSEWLSGYAMANLGNHWLFSPFRLFLSSKMTDLLIVHWFGAFFDLTVSFFLIYELTRPMAMLFAASFHLMNSRLFSIGMFPWVCLVELPIFYHHDWPKYMLHRITFGRAYQQYNATTDECGKRQAVHESKCSINKKSILLTHDYSKKSKSFVILNNKKINNNCNSNNGHDDNDNNNLAKEQKNLIKDDFSVQYNRCSSSSSSNRSSNTHNDNDSHNNNKNNSPFIFVKQFYKNLFCNKNNNSDNSNNNNSACKIKSSLSSGKEQPNEKKQNKFTVSSSTTATTVTKTTSTSSLSLSIAAAIGKTTTTKTPSVETKIGKKEEKHKNIVMTFIIIYCGLQIFLPYSHFITKGYNNWTNGLYGYSWDMMVHAWDTILVSVKVVDNHNGKVHFMEPYAFSETDRWTKHGDMAYQYAKCIEKNLLSDIQNTESSNKISISTNFSIYFDVWCSLNGRFQQRFYDPNVDMLKVKWSPFEEPTFVLPLLKELTRYRPKLEEFTEHVLSWSNHTDAMYIADFPNFIMDNYISKDLDNITLTVLEGSIVFIEERRNRSKMLTTGQNIKVKPNIFHKVKTVSSTPSSYMYTYVNKTMEIVSKQEPPKNDEKPLLPLKNELYVRFINYKNFMIHLGNSFLFEIYGVPMPVRKKH